MSLHMDFVCVRKRHLEESGGYSNHKRVCKGLGCPSKENGVLFQPLNECLMDYLEMQLAPPQESSLHKALLENVKQSSMIFQNHESRGPIQFCPRCIAGESGHINHIVSL